ncbi:MAG: A/G-specific adenine glycosylase [Edaphocola sp.]
MSHKKYFTKALLQWHSMENKRSLPWKEEKDPYKIWLSEVILQQTRAEQGRPYYEAFTNKYEDVHALASAPEEEVFRIWQGLGYYNRCRNMLATARHIGKDLNGHFPNKYEDIRALKGVGDYTAAAIASFAYNLPYAVLDGNVYRVLARYFGIGTPIDAPAGKKEFMALANSLLDASNPAAYNQAIMDFGAEICKPAKPLCTDCILNKYCVAIKGDMVGALPVKSKKLQVKQRHFHYLVLETEGMVFICLRKANDIWQNLHEFVLVETEGNIAETEQWRRFSATATTVSPNVFTNKQRLTHQVINSHFHVFRYGQQPDITLAGRWIAKGSIKNLAFPKTIISFFDRKKYF